MVMTEKELLTSINVLQSVIHQSEQLKLGQRIRSENAPGTQKVHRNNRDGSDCCRTW